MRKAMTLLLVFILAFGLFGCTRSRIDSDAPVELTVSAAASLTEAYGEIKEIFELEKGIKLIFNFASSGTLQKQIEEGAEIDVFVSAAVKQMDALEEENLIIKETRENIYKNELALLVAKEYKDQIKTINDIVAKNLKISIGVAESVPAGQYAKEALVYLGIWEQLEPNIVYAKDVSQVLTYVDKGEVAAGIVFSSDSVRAKESYLVELFPEETHTPIVYPAAVVASTKNKEASIEFMNYLRTDKAKKILEKYGFKLYIE